MLVAPRLRARRDAAIDNYAADPHSVAHIGKFFVPAQQVALALGAGRVAVGAVFLAAPVTSTRLLGLDSATAKRVTYLARMVAVRDLALGAGVLSASSDEAAVPWLVAAAAADAVDAVVIAGAVRRGTARGVVASGVVAGAAGCAAAGFWAASRLRSRLR